MSEELHTEAHIIFRETVRRFLAQEVVPVYEKWEDNHEIPRDFWRKAGEAGILCPGVPEAYGGAGGDYAFNAIVNEEIMSHGLAGLGGVAVHSDVVVPYLVKFGSEDQKREWLPRMVSGEVVACIGMTEPDTGSDLQAITTHAELDGNHYLINGQKAFTSNSYYGDMVLTAVKTDREHGAKGISLLIVETDREGFSRGQKTRKVGLHAMDQTQLYLEDVRVPATHMVGEEGRGFEYMMENLAQERLAIAVSSISHAEAALDWTIEFVKNRKAFGRTVMDFQNTQFKLAELKTEITIGRVFVDHCLALHVVGALDASKASMAKYWLSDLQGKVIDECVQLHGGAGYMWEYPIARAYVDARAARIYGGTNEIMKLIIARTL